MQAKQTILILFLVIFGCLTLTNSQKVWKKIIHNTDPQAKCLDGSPGSLYIHEGTQKDKFLLYFNGGGFCGLPTLADTIEDCYKRSKTDLGSSTLLPDTLAGTEGVLSLDEPLYGNWTKVFFNYCDGSLHQGDNAAPLQYKDTKLYFRGARIVRSHFKWLIDTYRMDQASKIMLGGGSAGAVASYLWGNYLASLIKNPQALYIIPDSGIFVNSITFKTNIPLIQMCIQTLMSIAHATQKTPLTECNSKYPGQQWRCIFSEVNYPYLKGKYLFINSEYDWWGIAMILQIKCLKDTNAGYTLANCSNEEMQAIEQYRAKYINLVNKMRTPQRGLWSIACSKHTYAPYAGFYDVDNQRIPMKNGTNVKEAIQAFMFQDKINWLYDTNSWPSNTPCAY